MGQPTFHKIQSEKTVPEWEAKCHAIRQHASSGPPSKVSATLTSIQCQSLVHSTVQLTPKQAREYAGSLIEAAREAEEFDEKLRKENES